MLKSPPFTWRIFCPLVGFSAFHLQILKHLSLSAPLLKPFSQPRKIRPGEGRVLNKNAWTWWGFASAVFWVESKEGKGKTLMNLDRDQWGNILKAMGTRGQRAKIKKRKYTHFLLFPISSINIYWTTPTYSCEENTLQIGLEKYPFSNSVVFNPTALVPFVFPSWFHIILNKTLSCVFVLDYLLSN